MSPDLIAEETEVNGDSKRAKTEILYVLVYWASRTVTRDFCSALAALVGPVQYIFFLTVHYTVYFNYFVPIAKQAGQAAVLGRLSRNVYVSGTGLWDKFPSSIKCGLFIPL